MTLKDNIFITDSRYIEEVNSYLTIDQEIAVYDMRCLSHHDCEQYFSGCKNVGFEEGYVTYEKYKNLLVTYRIDNLVETERTYRIKSFC